MTYTVQELALQYAETMVAFYQAKNSTQEDRSPVLRAREAMYEAQNALDQACQRQAELNA